MDANDNELAYLEAIHLFVEILGEPSEYLVHLHVLIFGPDSFFDNVCELDLVFNFYKVRNCDELRVGRSCYHAGLCHS